MEGSAAQQPAGNYVNTPNNYSGRLGISLIFGDFNDVATVFTGYDYISREPVPYFSRDWIKTSVFMLMPVASRSTARVITRSQVIQTVGEVVQPYLGRIKSIAGENAIIGFRGSLARGTVGNRRKPTYGNPVNLDDFDIDAFIISDELRKQGQWGNQIEGLDKLQQEMYEALRVRPEFQGLRQDGFGFRIFSREEAAKQFDGYELYFIGGKRE